MRFIALVSLALALAASSMPLGSSGFDSRGLAGSLSGAGTGELNTVVATVKGAVNGAAKLALGQDGVLANGAATASGAAAGTIGNLASGAGVANGAGNLVLGGNGILAGATGTVNGAAAGTVGKLVGVAGTANGAGGLVLGDA